VECQISRVLANGKKSCTPWFYSYFAGSGKNFSFHFEEVKILIPLQPQLRLSGFGVEAEQRQVRRKAGAKLKVAISSKHIGRDG
jgi:hypothetical protein